MFPRCTAEKITYLPRPAPRHWTLTGLDLRFRLFLRSPESFGHVPTSRVAGWNDFLRGLSPSISLKDLSLSSRLFQRFTARRASFGTSLVMYSQVFMDVPFAYANEAFTIPSSRFTHGGTSARPQSGHTLPRGGLSRPRIAVGAEIHRFTGAFLLGRRFFSSLDIAVHPSFFFTVPL